MEVEGHFSKVSIFRPSLSVLEEPGRPHGYQMGISPSQLQSHPLWEKSSNRRSRAPYPIAVVQSPSCVQLFVTPQTVACQASLSFTISGRLLTFMSIESVMPSNHLILCCSLLLPSIFPSIRVFSNELALHIRWPKYWSFSFSISPSREYSEFTVFRIDWFHLLAVQGTLKKLFQYHNLKASILQCSAFFMIQLSHP